METNNPTSNGEIMKQVSKLHEVLENNRVIISKLSTLISPVSVPSRPKPESLGEVGMTTDTPLGNELRQIVAFTEENNNNLNDLISRISI
jgi:hypothetical protein